MTTNNEISMLCEALNVLAISKKGNRNDDRFIVEPDFLVDDFDSIIVSTSPLAKCIGMALAQKFMGGKFNRVDLDLISHITACAVNGLAKGEEFEALTFARKLDIDKLVVFTFEKDQKILDYYSGIGYFVTNDALLGINNLPSIVVVDSQNTDFETAKNTCYKNGTQRIKKYNSIVRNYKKKYADLYAIYEQCYSNSEVSLSLDTKEELSGIDLGFVALNKLSSFNMNLLVGSCGLSKSSKNFIMGGDEFTADNPCGMNIAFDNVELMYEVMSGVGYYGALIPFCADIIANSYNLYRLKDVKRGVFIFLTDYSNMDFMAINPAFDCFRPCNGSEIAYAYEYAINSSRPTVIILSNQLLSGSIASKQNIEKGGYYIEKSNEPNAIILASGEQVSLAQKVKQYLLNRDIKISIVSVFNDKLFQKNIAILKELKGIKSIVAFDNSEASILARYLPLSGKVVVTKNQDLESLAKQVYEIVKRNGERSESIFR